MKKARTQEIALLTQKEQLSHPVTALGTPAAVIRGWELTSVNLRNREQPNFAELMQTHWIARFLSRMSERKRERKREGVGRGIVDAQLM